MIRGQLMSCPRWTLVINFAAMVGYAPCEASVSQDARTFAA